MCAKYVNILTLSKSAYTSHGLIRITMKIRWDSANIAQNLRGVRRASDASHTRRRGRAHMKSQKLAFSRLSFV
jgi:hypothetical protein